jgi:hypothetical protein
MVQSRAGWLCMSCGHIERKTDSTAPTPTITLGKDVRDQLAASSAENKPAESSDKDAPVAAASAVAPVASPWEPSGKSDASPAKGDDAAVPAVASDDTTSPASADASAGVTGAPSAADLTAVEQAVEEAKHSLEPAEPEAKDDAEPADDTKADDADKPSDNEANDSSDKPKQPEIKNSGEPLKPEKVADSPSDADKDTESHEDKTSDVSGPKPAGPDENDEKSDEHDKSAKSDQPEAEPEDDTDADEAAKESPAVVLPINKHRMNLDNGAAKDDAGLKGGAAAGQNDDDKPSDHANDKEDKAPEEDSKADDSDDDKLELVEKPKPADEEKEPVESKPDVSDKDNDESAKSDKVADEDEPDEGAAADAKPEDKSDSDETDDDKDKGSKDEPEPESYAAKTDHVNGTKSDDKAVEDDADSDEEDDTKSDKAQHHEPVAEEVDPEDTPPESLEQAEKDIEKDDEAAGGDAKAEEVADGPKPGVTDVKPADSPKASGNAAQPVTAEAKVAPPVPVYDTAPAASASPASSSDDALVPANAPVPAPGPSPSTPQAAPTKLNSVAAHTHPAPWTVAKTISLILGLIVIAIVAFFVYLFDFSAAGALGGYFQKLATSSSMTFNATVSYVNGDNSLDFNSQGVANTSQAKYNIKVEGQVSANAGALSSSSKAAAGSLAGTLTVIGHSLYFNQSSSKIINQLLPITVADNTWYQYNLDQDTAQCFSPSHNPLLGGGLGNAAPITGATLVGLESVDGEKMLHYRGTVDTTKLLADLQKANENVPAACRFDLTSADLQNMAITFDLWRGTTHDRFVVYANNTKVGSHTELTIDTTGYNQAVSITVPSSATTVTTDAKGVLGAETINPAANAATDVATSNTERQAALARFASAYAATAQNGYLFTNPPQVTVSAVDPSTGQPYVVQTTAPTGYGQIEYAAGRQCDGQSITPGKLATRHVALYMLMQGSATPTCLDIK